MTEEGRDLMWTLHKNKKVCLFSVPPSNPKVNLLALAPWHIKDEIMPTKSGGEDGSTCVVASFHQIWATRHSPGSHWKESTSLPEYGSQWQSDYIDAKLDDGSVGTLGIILLAATGGDTFFFFFLYSHLRIDFLRWSLEMDFNYILNH